MPSQTKVSGEWANVDWSVWTKVGGEWKRVAGQLFDFPGRRRRRELRHRAFNGSHYFVLNRMLGAEGFQTP